MSKKKYFILLPLLAFLMVLPVSAAQLKNQSANAQSSAETTEDATRGTADYIKTRIQEMKTLKAEERAAAKKQIVDRVRGRVLAMIQNAIRRYERVLTQVEKAEGLTAEEKAEATTQINAQIEEMNKLKIQMATADTTEEVKAAMTQVKSRFKFSLGLVRQSVNGVYENRLNNALTKLTDIYTKLSAKVEAMPEGNDKSNLQASLSEAQTLLADAKVKIEAKDLVTAKDDLVGASENLKEVAMGVK